MQLSPGCRNVQVSTNTQPRASSKLRDVPQSQPGARHGRKLNGLPHV
jgi:hypothetical protein